MAKYVDKDALVAEIKERINRNDEKAATYSSNSEHDYLYRVKEAVYKNLLSFLDTLEVKEVDLNEEIEKCLKQHSMLAVGRRDFTSIAKHFFELGLKAKDV